jgi:hypothetical protein
MARDSSSRIPRRHLLGWPAAAMCGAQSHEALLLAAHGQSRYSICLDASAAPAERRAAHELAAHLAALTGARLPVVEGARVPDTPLILVGQRLAAERLNLDPAELPPGAESFRIETVGVHLALAGRHPRGTLYAVYTLLDQLGCRWYTRDVTRVPSANSLRLPPARQRIRPPFEYREIYYTEAQDKDWAARNRLNGGLSQLDESTGGKVQFHPFVHSFHDLLPAAKYFSAHPEYFAEVAGARQPEKAQLCLTNPAVLRIATERVFEWIREHPEATLYSVSQNDCEGWCECARCRQVEQEEGGQPSGPILRFVNAIAAAVEKRHPDKLIETLAYTYSEGPPARTRPRANVRIRLCPIGVCHAHPYQDCRYNRFFMRNLEAWSRVTRQLYVWHYVTNFWHYLLPHPNFDELAADIPMYQRHGVVGLFLQGAVSPGGGGENAELRSYVLARLLWDPHADAWREVDAFLGVVYGQAAPYLRAWLDRTHRLVRHPPEGEGQPIWTYRGPRFAPSVLAEGKRLFDQAEAAAENPAVRGRVQKARLSVEWAGLIEGRRFVFQGADYTPANPDALRAQFADFFARAGGFGITHLHEWHGMDIDERERLRYLRAFRAVTLENETLRLQIVPQLSGRMVRMVHKPTGLEALRQPDPDERSYPDQGGLVVFVHPEFSAWGRSPWTVEWELESAGPDEAAIVGRLENGLRVRRRFTLVGAEVRTHTLLENPGTQPVRAGLQVRAEFNPRAGEDADVEVSFRRRSGARVQRRLLPPPGVFFGVESYLGEEAPDAAWELRNRTLGLTLRNRFEAPQVERCWLWWRGRGENRVYLCLWSPFLELAPGARVELASGYEAEPLARDSA